MVWLNLWGQTRLLIRQSGNQQRKELYCWTRQYGGDVASLGSNTQRRRAVNLEKSMSAKSWFPDRSVQRCDAEKMVKPNIDGIENGG